MLVHQVELLVMYRWDYISLSHLIYSRSADLERQVHNVSDKTSATFNFFRFGSLKTKQWVIQGQP